jgi:autotransporter family porin
MGSASPGGVDVNSGPWMMQGGGDVTKFSLFGGNDRLHLGAMAGYAGGRTDANGPGAPLTSGGGAGMYATWYQNDRSRLGWYADVWGQYSRFNNQIQPGFPDRSNYDSQTGMLSAETGYAIRLGETSNWVIEPQGQIIYLRNRVSSPYASSESLGSGIEGFHGGFASRLGVRLRGSGIQDAGWRVRPYAAVNWWYDNTGEELLGNPYSVRDPYPGSRYELKAGVNVDFRSGWAGWGDLGWQWGNQSYQAWTVRGGMKYAW